jgi:hypothetical protein
VRERSVTLVWAISTVDHWDDPAAGHAAHGLTADQADALAAQLAAAGFTHIHTDPARVGRRTLIILADRSPG